MNVTRGTQIFFKKYVYFSKNCQQTNKIVKSQPKFALKPEITAKNPSTPEFDYRKLRSEFRIFESLFFSQKKN
jgi:hypothetical protein